MIFQKPAMIGLFIVLSSSVSMTAIGRVLDESPDLSSLSGADLKTLTVRLERIGCYGTCPAYTITIHGDGQVEYNGKSHVRQIGTRAGQVEIETIKSLVSEFARARFWSIPEEFSDQKCNGRYCTDMATAVTELSLKGVTHRVKHYYGCGSAPRSLFDLESAVDKAAKVEQWTGDVSKAGPFGTTCWDEKRNN